MSDRKQRQHIFKCDCHGPHFLCVSWWPGDPREGLEMEGWIELEGSFWTTWKYRAKYAWEMLAQRGHASTNIGIVLSPDRLGPIIAALSECKAEWDKYLEDLAAAKAPEVKDLPEG